MSHKAYEELFTLAALGATHKGDDECLREHAADCPECHRQSIDLRETLAPADETEAGRLNRVLNDFSRVLDAQLDECDKWESTGDLYIVSSQLIN